MSPSINTAPTGPIFSAPPPWNTKATMYLIPFWTSSKTAANLPEKAYHPLEHQSPFSSPQESGKALGGLSMVQIIRYHETPVGPYDELILCPGTFEYPLPDSQDQPAAKKTGKAMRITRIYVSQKYTCWNGRKLWNLPKHLARFEWSTPDPSNPQVQTLRVYPHDHSPPGVPYNATESSPSTTPFFKCTLKTIPYLPSFPFSNLWLPKMGIDVTLVQPPLPENSQASQGELPGTGEDWVKMGGYEQVSKRCKVMWADMDQNEEGGEKKEKDNFFPGLKKWNLAVVMEGGEANFVDGERWSAPRYTL
ncbi:hypothetical protein QBC40DRAFT_226474 [Triangularia verruculosa]|uniref:Uncharacterized protein n=1 Tax=Triangularia verruculosa TaxID=2587418 RepID=A0AAN6XI71_9PEZI|nr:hypothetical protein QBC40DRAFT_226474 [Triangularia verruculosa]